MISSLLTFALIAGAPHASAATSADCPWTDVTSVDHDMGSVTVNGSRYRTRGSYANSEFKAVLQRCGLAEANKHFRAWRADRRWVNIDVAIGLFVPFGWPFLVVAPIHAALAGDQATKMEDAILKGQ